MLSNIKGKGKYEEAFKHTIKLLFSKSLGRITDANAAFANARVLGYMGTLLVKMCEYPLPHLKARASIEANRAYTGILSLA